VLRRERGKSIAHVAMAFPELSPNRHRTIVRGMFRHLGSSLFEICWIPNLDRKNLMATTDFEGLENLQAAVDAGKGVVLFTGHCGNWEWLGASITLVGFQVNTIAREISDPRMNEFIVETRGGVGIGTIGRGSASSAKAILQTLRSGRILAMLIDQNIDAENVELPFFGIPALTPVGPARLAIRSGAAAIAAFIERRGSRQHVRFESPLFTRKDDDPRELTRIMTESIERQVRRCPEQWVWMHKRWRVRKSPAPLSETDSSE
jgi:KDO2-lipid IV(A) lauroyltransferase